VDVKIEKMSVSFDPIGPPDPNDPRILPASMQFSLVRKESCTYIEWNIAEGVRIGGLNPKKDRPFIVRTLLSPSDARMIAQQLLDAATWAEGGSGLPRGMEHPPPPPPPPSPRK
jgi:hypothetical protein